MGRTKRIKPAPARFPAPKLKEVNGVWSVSYNLVDVAGPFSWPSESQPGFSNIATLMAKLSTYDYEDCIGLKRASGKPAHGPATSTSESADERLRQLSESSQQLELLIRDGELTHFTYCYDYDQPERIYGIRQGSVIYLLWWDPRHEVSGTPSNREKPACRGRSSCHHP